LEPIEKQNAFNQLVGVLHFVDCFGVLVRSEHGHAPMPQHAGMQEILIDRSQLVLQNRVQMLQNGRIATHSRLQEDSAWKHLVDDIVPTARPTSLPSTRRRCYGLWVRELDHLPQQLPYIGDAFAASRLCAEGPVDRRYRAILVHGMGAKVAIGNGVAEANVHAGTLQNRHQL
jgi:hypothetical protein